MTLYRQCGIPTCPALTLSRYCPQHEQQRRRQYDRDRQEDKAFYTSKRWRRVRLQKLRRNPLCECGCNQLAEEVHHKQDRKDRPDLAYELDNLEALTKACHSRETLKRNRLKGLIS